MWLFEVNLQSVQGLVCLGWFLLALRLKAFQAPEQNLESFLQLPPSLGDSSFCYLSLTPSKVKVKVSHTVMSDSAIMGCSLLGSSVRRILQARILERVVISFSRESFQPRDWTLVSCIAGRFFTSWATREALVPQKLYPKLNKALFSFLAFQPFLPESADAQGKKVALRLRLTLGFPLLSDFGLVIL